MPLLSTASPRRSFDLIVSNPPSVPETDRATLEREVRDHEPALALYAGPDGLEIYRRLIPEAARLLKPGGRLILELGYNSLEGVRRMLDDKWRDIAIVHDFAQVPRVLSLSRLK